MYIHKKKSNATWNVLHHMPPRYENHKSLPSTTFLLMRYVKVAAAFRDVLPLYAAGFLLQQSGFFFVATNFTDLRFKSTHFPSDIPIFPYVESVQFLTEKKMVRPWDPAIKNWGRSKPPESWFSGCHLIFRWFQCPSPKFNSSPPEKLPGWAPIGKERIRKSIVFLYHHFLGANSLLNFGDVNVLKYQEVKNRTSGGKLLKLPGC